MPAYPPHQRGKLIEAYFYDFYLHHQASFPPESVYLPVFWTDYYLNHDYGRRPLRRLQEFLDRSIVPGKRYFTVIQHVDGILNYLPPDTVITFAAGGTGDIPIPLLCDAHPTVEQPRDVFASFIGMPTHFCRRQLHEVARDNPDFRIVETDDIAKTLPVFEDLMNRSLFALCPRGHGTTSFRLYEALQMGSIPVYPFDDLWLPYTQELNWRRFSVLVHISEIRFLPDILRTIDHQTITAMQAAVREVHAAYFTLEACARWILKTLQIISREGFRPDFKGRSVHESRFMSLWTSANLGYLRRQPQGQDREDL